MISQMAHVMTLANSIIGVSVLAMPFCFKQCGIALAAIVLLLCCVLSRLACHFLVKSAVMSRRRNFELLAFHAFGHMGKFMVELFIIGFLVGTCIAFFVVVGDLGPQIIGKLIDKNPEDIRTSLLITTSVFIVLPLGLLRNIDSLSSICTATIAFYLCLVLKVMAESMQHIFAGDWYEHVYFWRPSGILQCLPIFSMALFCQTQLFEIYETIPNVSLEKMNEVVRGALNICTIVYLCVGFFGYIAFCTQSFTGNILMSLEPTLSSDMIKVGFVFSVAFSFPLVIFPCRASLNSLLFRRVHTHEPSMNYLPEARFRCLTIAIVSVSLITGILIPNIEFVLGLVGSTIGVMICLIFPAIFFISISSKHTNERLLAQAILFIGVCIMILGTYANLYAMEESTNTKPFVTTNKPLSQINNLPLHFDKEDVNILKHIPESPKILPNIKENIADIGAVNVPGRILDTESKDIRQEPPIPVERVIVTEKSVIISQKAMENLPITLSPAIRGIVEEIKTLEETAAKDSKVIKDNSPKRMDSVTPKSEQTPLKDTLTKLEAPVDTQKSDNLINSDALKKEDTELAADVDAANIIAAERREELWKTLEKNKLEELQMMREQKESLKNIKDIQEQQKEKDRDKQKVPKDVENIKENNDQPVHREEQLVGKENAYQVVNALNENGKNVVNEIQTRMENTIQEKISEDLNNVQPKSPTIVKESEGNANPIIIGISGLPVKRDPNSLNFNNDVPHNDILHNAVATKQNNFNSQMILDKHETLMKGPIVNALTKRTLQKSVVLDVEKDQHRVLADKTGDTNNDSVPDLNKNVDLKIPEQKVQKQFSLPIALKMGNQTKFDSISQQLANKTQEDVLLIGRDILENHDREKREAEAVAEIDDAKNITITLSRKNNTMGANTTTNNKQKECLKPIQTLDIEEPLKLNKSEELSALKSYTTETSLIKTNVYLADQVVENAISVDANIEVRGEFVKLKQRDLKAVDSN